MKVMEKREAYEMLANAIIKQAADDYRNAHRKLLRMPHDFEAKKRIREVEVFFQSQELMGLTTLDGEYLLRKLKEEVSGYRLKPVKPRTGKKPGRKPKKTA